MTIELTAEQADVVSRLIESGAYRSAEEVVDAMLRAAESGSVSPYAPGELDTMLAEAKAQIRRGESYTLEQVRAHLSGTSNNLPIAS